MFYPKFTDEAKQKCSPKYIISVPSVGWREKKI